MPFAVECDLDDEVAAVMRSVGERLAASGVAPSRAALGERPHVTLAVYDDVDLHQLESVVAACARAWPPLPISFASLGCFTQPRAVVFAAPVVTTELLALHRAFHQQVQERSSLGPGWAHYWPDRWVPHATLAMDMPPAALPAAVEVCRSLPLPLAGQLRRIGVVEFRPVVGRFHYRLGDGERSPTWVDER